MGKWHLASGRHREEGLYEPDLAAVQAYREKNPETEYVPPGPGQLGYGHWQAFSGHGQEHGRQSGPPDGVSDKMAPYAEAMNIPLLIRWPKQIVPGSRIDALQTPMDHLPTLCGLAGLSIPREVDGADLSQTVLGKGGDSREEVLIGSYTSDWDFCQTGTSWPEWRGVKTKQYTYCRWLTGEEELYDNLEDPFQMNNLASGGAPSAVQTRLRGRLKELLAAAHDDFPPGTAYGAWYDDRRNLLRTALGPVSG